MEVIILIWMFILKAFLCVYLLSVSVIVLATFYGVFLSRRDEFLAYVKELLAMKVEERTNEMLGAMMVTIFVLLFAIVTWPVMVDWAIEADKGKHKSIYQYLINKLRKILKKDNNSF